MPNTLEKRKNRTEDRLQERENRLERYKNRNPENRFEALYFHYIRWQDQDYRDDEERFQVKQTLSSRAASISGSVALLNFIFDGPFSLTLLSGILTGVSGWKAWKYSKKLADKLQGD